MTETTETKTERYIVRAETGPFSTNFVEAEVIAVSSEAAIEKFKIHLTESNYRIDDFNFRAELWETTWPTYNFSEEEILNERVHIEHDGEVAFLYEDCSRWSGPITEELSFSIEELEEVLKTAKRRKSEYDQYLEQLAQERAREVIR